MIQHDPKFIGVERAQIGYHRNQHVLHALLVKREREMVMIYDVRAVLWPQDDGDHVMAKKLSDLLRRTLAQALSFVIDLA
jgi:hypothetical protein